MRKCYQSFKAKHYCIDGRHQCATTSNEGEVTEAG